ncbi:hypothetical protein [Kitasatospora sp. NPDC057541]|uniref:hypothetical protein n=1 Tax=unclassified Kitasatospora TaxID=2633591 RepID=UPI0036B64482
MSVLSASTKNSGSSSATRRRRIATVAATLLIAGSVQLLAAESSSACAGPYRANNPQIPAAARAVQHKGPINSVFLSTPGTLTRGSKIEVGTQIGNFTGGDFSLAAPALTLTGKGARLRAQDVTVEVFVNGAWKKLGVDGGCGGEAVRVDTSPLLQPLKDGRASRLLFRIGLSAKAPAGQSAVSVTLSAWSESGSGAKSTRTVKVVRAAGTPGKAAAGSPRTHG